MQRNSYLFLLLFTFIFSTPFLRAQSSFPEPGQLYHIGFSYHENWEEEERPYQLTVKRDARRDGAQVGFRDPQGFDGQAWEFVPAQLKELRGYQIRPYQSEYHLAVREGKLILADPLTTFEDIFVIEKSDWDGLFRLVSIASGPDSLFIGQTISELTKEFMSATLMPSEMGRQPDGEANLVIETAKQPACNWERVFALSTDASEFNLNFSDDGFVPYFLRRPAVEREAPELYRTLVSDGGEFGDAYAVRTALSGEKNLVLEDVYRNAKILVFGKQEWVNGAYTTGFFTVKEGPDGFGAPQRLELSLPELQPGSGIDLDIAQNGSRMFVVMNLKSERRFENRIYESTRQADGSWSAVRDLTPELDPEGRLGNFERAFAAADQYTMYFRARDREGKYALYLSRPTADGKGWQPATLIPDIDRP
ncbi:MAG: hypothetical protein AAF570_12035, partial [Bacteroidota bacterium]